jgi:hypothetical protein
MTLYEFDGKKPQVPADSFVHPQAVLIGDVRIGPDGRQGWRGSLPLPVPAISGDIEKRHAITFSWP